MKYNYNIFIVPSFFIKLAVFFDKLWVWSPWFGAYFSIIYNAFVKRLNKKLWLNFKLVITDVYKISKDDKLTYSLWIKKYSKRKYGKMWSDWDISLMDLNDLAELSWWVAHNLWYTPKMWGKIIDTAWENPVNMSVEALRKWANLGLFWTPLRTIVPWDDETREVVKLTKIFARAEFKWKLEECYIKYSWYADFDKALELYTFGRD